MSVVRSRLQASLHPQPILSLASAMLTVRRAGERTTASHGTGLGSAAGGEGAVTSPPSPAPRRRWFHDVPTQRAGRAEAVSPIPAGAAAASRDLDHLLRRKRLDLAIMEARLAFLRQQAEALERPPRPAPPPTRVAEAFWSPIPPLGFRMWRLTSQGMRGVVRSWPEPALEAICQRGPGVPHDDPGCRCGIYAFKEAAALCPAGIDFAPMAVHGLVALTGKVVEHERGYRAQRGQVLAVALVFGGALICRSDPAWIAGLFAPGLGRAAVLEAEGMRGVGAEMPRWRAEYLEDEARRFRDQWT